MLVIRKADLQSALSQQILIQTSASPDAPPRATAEHTSNSVVIRISSFTTSQVCYIKKIGATIVVSKECAHRLS